MLARAGAALCLMAFFSTIASAAPLKVFTDRPKDRLEKVFQAFSVANGETVEIVSAPYAELKQRLSQGEVADVLLLKDVLSLADAAHSGFYQPSNTKAFERVRPFMRDPQGLWTALTFRVRTAIYDPAILAPESLNRYESLAKPEFSGQVCMRNAKEYMPAFTAWLIERTGIQGAEQVLVGFKQNMARDFTEGDSASIKEFESGKCSVTLGNHYYLARLKNKDVRFPAEIRFFDQDAAGVHTNGFGGGIVKGSAQFASAQRLLEFLLTTQGQALLVAEPSFEYPAATGELPAPVVANFGTFKMSEISWAKFSENAAEAQKLLDKVGWAK